MNGLSEVEPSRTAVLVIDCQVGGIEGWGPPDQADYLERIRRVCAVSKRAGCVPIYVTTQFRPGYPEVARTNKMLAAAIDSTGLLVEGDPSTALHPALATDESDVLVTKRRINAFLGSDLHQLLRARGVESLVFTGLVTGGAVLSTLRFAADLDYQLVVLADCCHDPDPVVHQTLIERVFPSQATVTCAATWSESLEPRDGPLDGGIDR